MANGSIQPAPHCDDCGTLLHRDTRLRTVTYKRRTLVVQQPGWYCTANEAHGVVYDEADIITTEPEMLAFRASVEGSLPPVEIARIRKRLGLSQRQAGRVLGGGPMAFHKYEKGEVAVTRSVALLLSLLDRHPELLDEIATGTRQAA